MTVFEKIKYILDENLIEYKLSEHATVTTSEEAAAIRGVELKTGAKAMVAKTGGKYILFVLPADKKIDWSKLKNILSVKDIALASTEEAEQITGCKRGSVPPFGNVLEIETIYDKSILENEYVNFNPGSLTHSIQMRSVDLISLVKPIIFSFIKDNNDPSGS